MIENECIYNFRINTSPVTDLDFSVKAGAACLIDEKERKIANELDENVYRIQQIIL